MVTLPGCPVSVTVFPEMVAGPDCTEKLTGKLLDAVNETGADLVVMASHVPGVLEHIFSSNAGYVARHAKVSVFVVR